MQSIRPTTLIAVIALLLGSAILLWQKESALQIVEGVFNKPATTYNLFDAKSVPVGSVKKLVKSGNPKEIEIPSLNIKLPIVPGVYDTVSQTWTLSWDKAQFATNTPLPNDDMGNTFIYGHNARGVFNTLHKIKTGEKLAITTDNNLRFNYVFVGSQEVMPNNDSLFSYKGPAMLTVQTCSGSFYQNRQLFAFRLDSVEDISYQEEQVNHEQFLPEARIPLSPEDYFLVGRQ